MSPRPATADVASDPQVNDARGAVRRTETGVSGVETALVVALVTLVCIGGVTSIQRSIAGDDSDGVAAATQALGTEEVVIDSSSPDASAPPGGGGGTFGEAGNGITNTNVSDAGFETNPEGDDNWTTYSSGQTVGAWTVTSGSVDVKNSDWHEFGFGQRFVDINGHGPGTLEQQIEVVPGASYDMSIVLGENDWGGPAVKKIAIEWNGERVSTLAVDLSRYEAKTFAVKLPPSDDPNATLVIRSLTGSAHGVFLDEPTLTRTA
ncbi:MAG: hypothetical protein AAF467_15595 [Actinomycetota bacterium]